MSSANTCPIRGTPDFFSGDATLPVDPDDKYSQRYWVALRLNAIDAESLSCGESSETYRLVWTFDARTKLVTVAAGADGNWTVESTHYLQSRQPKAATVIARSPTRYLSANEGSEFVDYLSRSQLWTTPGWRETDASHGPTWLLEARSSLGYRLVQRKNTNDPLDCDIRALKQWLLRVSGVGTNEAWDQ